MCIAIFDDVEGGHHPGYTNGIAAALLRAGLEPKVFTPHEPPAVQGRNDWVPVLPATVRQVARGRRNVKLAAKACLQGSPSQFWDLYLDKNIWALPWRLRQFDRRVHVLHHSTQYSFRNRSGSARLRTALARQRLRSLVASDDLLVVHTQRAFDVLSGFLPQEAILRCGYPLVESASGEAETRQRGNSGRLLFVGNARREKGLDLLLEALELVNNEVPLDVVGRQDPVIRKGLEERFTMKSVRWIDRYVDDEELADYYREAAAVVVPYRSSFLADGGASGILLEALAHGVPVVITPAVQDQLPAAYGGAIVAAGNGAEALSAALEDAVDQVEDLQAMAGAAGPPFIRKYHSFDRYVQSILAATR